MVAIIRKRLGLEASLYQILQKGYVLDSGGIHMRSHVGRAPPPATGPRAGLPVGGPGRPPRSRGTAPQSCCRSDYLSQAHSPFLQILSVTLFEKTPILRALQACDPRDDLHEDSNQLILFDF